MTHQRRILLTAAFVTAAAAVLPAANWPQWRGADGQGVSPEAGLPDAWSPEAGIAWKTPLPGVGHSQPIVWEDRVFLTTAIEGGPAPEGHSAPVHMVGGEAWMHPDSVGYVLSNILYGDYVYLVSDKGIVTCLDARTGKVVYEGGRVPVPATFMASPVAYDGKLLLTSIDGDTFVLQAGPEHRVLRTNSIGEPAASTPALSQGRVLIRGAKHLYCIRRS